MLPTKARRIVWGALLALTPLTLFADAQSGADFQKALRLYEAKEYAKAVPLLENLAKRGNKAAMYRLANLYEKGLGVPQDYKEAAHWYKEAARSYSYTVATGSEHHDVHAKTFAERLKAQFTPASTRAASAAALAKVDTPTPETKSFLDDMASGRFFGLTPYKTNYLLPVSVASRSFKRQPSGYKSYAIADEIVPLPDGASREALYGEYDKKVEVEFQFSLKKNLTYNLFGYNEYITAAYTQQSFWQLYSKSGPFRETNYMPEFYVAIPTSAAIDADYGLKVTKWGFIHQSNGQEGYRSRSWNRLYVEGLFQWGNLFVKPRVWYRLPEKDKPADWYRGYTVDENGTKHLTDPLAYDDRDDNPDILDYMGYGDLTVNYLWGNHQFGGLFRYNFGKGGHNRGAIQLTWSYPFFGSKNTFWYAKLFNGYGLSLIDYNVNNTVASFGFAFSRGLME
ncbi:phospholipase A [Hydrogenimonas sp.]